ncbi:ABC-2 type transport system permease protein [Agromyces cerinus subsp. cerinus]|uniref:ABC-2 type transport system permease protein n=1 Tax=Agromyces cerinus subsp. cerinus TaxID=232089 RepID=A0A1N6HKU9_9MICO|nr:ABC-2 type transport system permease protein [Agromyces cerinus subsp. cerinus]
MNARHRFAIAVTVEGRKLRAARVPVVTALLFVAGVTAICMSVTIAVTNGSAELVTKLGPLVAEGGWAGYLSSATQVVGAGGFIACGVVLSWSFGREFAEGTITGLFALPVGRAMIAAAKLVVFFAWAIAVSALSTAAIILGGLAAGLGSPGAESFASLGRVFVLIVLTALMAVPAAWVATLSRGLLGGIAATIALVASAQVLVISGAGAWYPPAAPALWAMDPASVDGAALALSSFFPLLFAVLTLLAWRHLQLDRA